MVSPVNSTRTVSASESANVAEESRETWFLYQLNEVEFFTTTPERKPSPSHRDTRMFPLLSVRCAITDTMRKKISAFIVVLISELLDDLYFIVPSERGGAILAAYLHDDRISARDLRHGVRCAFYAEIIELHSFRELVRLNHLASRICSLLWKCWVHVLSGV